MTNRIDTRVMPIIIVVWMLNFLDRNTLSQARLYGIQEHTNVKGIWWQTAIGINQIGYILMQLPAALVITKVRPSIYVPSLIISWGIVSTSAGFIKSAGGLIAARLFLGIVEAPFFPYIIYYMTCWYTPEQLALRIAIMFSGSMFAHVYAGPLCAGILNGMDGVAGLQNWRWLFIIIGLVTVFFGLLAIFVLPSEINSTDPISKHVIDDERPADEKDSMEKSDSGAKDSKTDSASSQSHAKTPQIGSFAGLKAAICDIHVCFFIIMEVGLGVCGGYHAYFPTIVQQLGFEKPLISSLLTAPPYAVAFLLMPPIAWWTDKKGKRSIFGLSCAVLVTSACLILICTPTRYLWTRYAILCILPTGSAGVGTIVYAWLSSTIPAPETKKASAIGLVNMLAHLASFAGSYAWHDHFVPDYKEAWAISFAFIVVCMIGIVLLRLKLQKDNKRWDRLKEEREASGRSDDEHDDLMTKKAMSEGFRYVI